MLGQLRDLLLEQHKILIHREREEYEKAHGPVGGPGQFLRLLLNEPAFAWLKQISTLVVEIDEALSRKSTAGQTEADALLVQAGDLMRPRETGSDFQVRYNWAVQESPEVTILQCKIERLLGI